MKIVLTYKKSTTINPLMTNVPYHIETSQSIFNSNQLTGFYMQAFIQAVLLMSVF